MEQDVKSQDYKDLEVKKFCCEDIAVLMTLLCFAILNC